MDDEDKFSAKNYFGFDLEENTTSTDHGKVPISKCARSERKSAKDYDTMISVGQSKQLEPSSKTPTKAASSTKKLNHGKKSRYTGHNVFQSNKTANTKTESKFVVLPALASKGRKEGPHILPFKEWKKDLSLNTNKKGSVLKMCTEHQANSLDLLEVDRKRKVNAYLHKDEKIKCPCRSDIRETVMQIKSLNYQTVFTCNGCKTSFETEIKAKLHCANSCKKLLATDIKPKMAYSINTYFCCNCCGESFIYQKVALDHVNKTCPGLKNKEKSDDFEIDSCQQNKTDILLTCDNSEASMKASYHSSCDTNNDSCDIAVMETQQSEEKEASDKRQNKGESNIELGGGCPEINSAEGYPEVNLGKGNLHFKTKEGKSEFKFGSDEKEIFVEILKINGDKTKQNEGIMQTQPLEICSTVGKIDYSKAYDKTEMNEKECNVKIHVVELEDHKIKSVAKFDKIENMEESLEPKDLKTELSKTNSDTEVAINDSNISYPKGMVDNDTVEASNTFEISKSDYDLSTSTTESATCMKVIKPENKLFELPIKVVKSEYCEIESHSSTVSTDTLSQVNLIKTETGETKTVVKTGDVKIPVVETEESNPKPDIKIYKVKSESGDLETVVEVTV